MDWNTLLSVLLGGILATIPIIISNRFQAKEREKDREEQRREAQIQLALELDRNDIKVLEDSIDECLKSMDYLRILSLEARGQSTPDAESRFNKLIGSDSIANKLAATIGEEFFFGISHFYQIII